jgi:hypothetical protein
MKRVRSSRGIRGMDFSKIESKRPLPVIDEEVWIRTPVVTGDMNGEASTGNVMNWDGCNNGTWHDDDGNVDSPMTQEIVVYSIER